MTWSPCPDAGIAMGVTLEGGDPTMVSVAYISPSELAAHTGESLEALKLVRIKNAKRCLALDRHIAR